MAGLLLELLVDQHAVDEQRSVRQFTAVGTVHHVQEDLETWQFTEYLFFGKVVAHEVADGVLAVAAEGLAVVVDDRWDSREGLAPAEIDEELGFA
jgi:hypothetical protein